MRLRTTWNREALAKLAASLNKKAEDPRAMNQDHLKEQPSAEKYVIGGPSDFAEDVHPSAGTWKAEYSGDEVKRNEIGMPEMRKDTFNHPEKTASEDGEDEELLEKKAEVCIDIATRMLSKTASEQAIEDQALALMHIPNAALIEMANRMAADEEEGDEEQKKEAGELPPWLKKDDDKDGDKEEKSQEKKEAGQVPEALKDHQFKKDDDGKDKDQEQKKEAQDQKSEEEPAKDQEQKKEAQDQMAMYSAQACQAVQQGDMQLAQQLVQQMAQLQQQPPAQQQMMSQEQAQQQVQQMLQQAMQGQGQQPMGDDQLLDQMLTAGDEAVTASGGEFDIELESNNIDTGTVHLGSEDEALKALFASNEEVRNALSLTGETLSTPAPMARTASTRTVGTRPTNGVSSIGGGMSESSGSNDIDKLSGLWQSAPDVKKVFNP